MTTYSPRTALPPEVSDGREADLDSSNRTTADSLCRVPTRAALVETNKRIAH